MYRLRDEYSDQIDFFDLDVDISETKEVRQQFGLSHRGQYALIDADGNIIKNWFGPLNEEAMFEELAQLLQELEAS